MKNIFIILAMMTSFSQVASASCYSAFVKYMKQSHGFIDMRFEHLPNDSNVHIYLDFMGYTNSATCDCHTNKSAERTVEKLRRYRTEAYVNMCYDRLHQDIKMNMDNKHAYDLNLSIDHQRVTATLTRKGSPKIVNAFSCNQRAKNINNQALRRLEKYKDKHFSKNHHTGSSTTATTVLF